MGRLRHAVCGLSDALDFVRFAAAALGADLRDHRLPPGARHQLHAVQGHRAPRSGTSGGVWGRGWGRDFIVVAMIVVFVGSVHLYQGTALACL